METTRQFLQRRERELVQEVAELRAQLTPKEVELAEVRRAKSAIAKSGVSANLVTGIFRPEPGIAESLSSALGIGDPLSSSCRGLVPAGLSGRSLISEALSSALDNIFEGGPAGAEIKLPLAPKSQTAVDQIPMDWRAVLLRISTTQ